MKTIKTNLSVAAVTLAVSLVLAACDRSTDPDASESVLRVHDVSGLEVEELDSKLNGLLSREDLPLRGKVELLDDSRLAVNASRVLQDEISEMIDQLRDHAPSDGVQRPFRVEFWILRMAKGPGAQDLPDYLANELQPLLAQYEGYGLSVYDYLESFHSGLSAVDNISSGRRTNVYFRRVATSGDEIELHARVSSRSPNSRGSIQYRINHILKPGKALVLGRVHDGGGSEDASYQVLVARAEWTESAH